MAKGEVATKESKSLIDPKTLKLKGKKVVKASTDKPAKVSTKDKAKAKLEVKSSGNIGDVVDYCKILDEIEEHYELASSQLMNNPQDRMSTGLLVVDLILGGGIVAGGWYTFFGPEQSAKSTLKSVVEAAAVKADIPVIGDFDYEGSSMGDYIENIMRKANVQLSMHQLFGLRDPKTGEWLIKPRIRYYPEGIAEKFFQSMSKLQRAIPDIKRIGERTFLVLPDDKKNRKVLTKLDEKLTKKTGMLHMEIEKPPKIQALWLVDSYPSMLPAGLDDDDKGESMAAQAIMFAKNLKKVKGRMKPKKITVLGINQLREKPGVMYGNPFYEPGGNALKLYSDVRIQCTPRSVPHGKGQFEEEESVLGDGADTYRYIHWKAIKNKLSTPNLEGWGRIWVKDFEGKAWGFDWCWDVFQYAKMTGQVTGTRNKLHFKCPEFEGQAKIKAMNWLQFKVMVLGDKDDRAEVLADIGYKGKTFSLHESYRKQMRSGAGVKLFFEASAAAACGARDSDDEDDD